MKQYIIISWDGRKLKNSELSKTILELNRILKVESIATSELNESEVNVELAKYHMIVTSEHDLAGRKQLSDMDAEYSIYIKGLTDCITKLCDIINVDTTPQTDFSKYELYLYRKIGACKTAEDVRYIQSLIESLYIAVTDKDKIRRDYVKRYLDKLGYSTSDIITLYNDSCKITISSDYE